MARPRTWFTPTEYAVARRTARVKNLCLWKYIAKRRSGEEARGYYIGAANESDLPIRIRRGKAFKVD